MYKGTDNYTDIYIDRYRAVFLELLHQQKIKSRNSWLVAVKVPTGIDFRLKS
jgi:hypothetical protein